MIDSNEVIFGAHESILSSPSSLGILVACNSAVIMPQVYCLLPFKGYFVRALNRQQAELEAVTTEIDGPIPVKVQTYS